MECGFKGAAILHTQSSQMKTQSLRMHFKKVHKVRLRLNNQGCLSRKMWEISMQTKPQGARNIQDTEKISSRPEPDTFPTYTSKDNCQRDSGIRTHLYILYPV